MPVTTELISEKPLQVRVTDPDHAGLDVVFTYQEIGGGQVFWVGFSLGPPDGIEPMDSEVLTVGAVRDFPVARWERAARARAQAFWHEALADAVALVQRRMDLESEVGRVAPDLADEANYQVARSEKGTKVSGGLTPAQRRRKERLTHLAGVAQEYRENVMAGVSDPAGAIARRREANPSTVRTWLKRAREVGLLPPVEPKGKGTR